MYRLAKTDRRANSSFKKYIYIYIILFIFIYLYINTVLVEREFVHCSWRTIFFFSTVSRDLCLIGFAFKAAVFETPVSQTFVYDTLLNTTRTLISFYTISLLFLHFIFKGEMRIFVLRVSFFSSFDKSYVLFGSDSQLPILSVTPWLRNIRRNV